jgi:hypothetical protein
MSRLAVSKVLRERSLCLLCEWVGLAGEGETHSLGLRRVERECSRLPLLLPMSGVKVHWARSYSKCYSFRIIDFRRFSINLS